MNFGLPTDSLQTPQQRPISALQSEPQIYQQIQPNITQEIVPRKYENSNVADRSSEQKSVAKIKQTETMKIQSEIKKKQSEIKALKRDLKSANKRREKAVYNLIAKTFISETKLDIFLTDDEIKKAVKNICQNGLKISTD